MQHAHLLNWFREIHLQPDNETLKARWNAAEKYAEELDQEKIVKLIRLFLFNDPRQLDDGFGEALIKFDQGFPLKDNMQELRLMAGIVIVVVLQSSSHNADALALGLRSAAFPSGRISPIQPEIFSLSGRYLNEEANKTRPDDFDQLSAEMAKTFSTHLTTYQNAVDEGDPSAIEIASEEFAENCTHETARSICRVSEESQLLWWLLCEHCVSLNQMTTELTPTAFALIAASEVAERIKILPPPPSISVILSRSLRTCRNDKAKNITLKTIVDATDPTWRAMRLKSVSLNGHFEIVPITTALSKAQDLDGVGDWSLAMTKSCSGVKGDLEVTPVAASQQFFAELMFLRALAAV